MRSTCTRVRALQSLSYCIEAMILFRTALPKNRPILGLRPSFGEPQDGRIDGRVCGSYRLVHEENGLGQNRASRAGCRTRDATFGGAKIFCEQAACEQAPEQRRKLTWLSGACRIQ